VNHLLREDLVRWRDEGRAEDRERITAHLAECEACTAAFAEVVRTAPLAAASTKLDPSKFVARGYAVRKASKPATQFVSWKAWAGALSAAALVILIVFVGMPPLDDDGDGPVTRGSITITTPEPTSLSWTSGVTAARYDVQLLDARQVMVFQSLTQQTSLNLPADVRAKLAPGGYTWKVTALDEEGRPIIAATRAVAIDAAK
jgi:hypothetical protein